MLNRAAAAWQPVTVTSSRVATITISIALALGAVIGVLLGLLGGGGSILAVPALVYVMRLPVEQAIPMSLIVIAIASAVGALPKVTVGQVQWRLAGIFAGAGIPATLVGGAVGGHLDPSIILVGFAVVMAVAGTGMLLDNPTSAPPVRPASQGSTGAAVLPGRYPPASPSDC